MKTSNKIGSNISFYSNILFLSLSLTQSSPRYRCCPLPWWPPWCHIIFCVPYLYVYLYLCASISPGSQSKNGLFFSSRFIYDFRLPLCFSASQRWWKFASCVQHRPRIWAGVGAEINQVFHYCWLFVKISASSVLAWDLHRRLERRSKPLGLILVMDLYAHIFPFNQAKKKVFRLLALSEFVIVYAI